MQANLIRRNSCTNAALQVACGWDQAEKIAAREVVGGAG